MVDLGVAVTGKISEGPAGDRRGGVDPRSAQRGMAARGERAKPKVEVIFLKNLFQHHRALEALQLDIDARGFELLAQNLYGPLGVVVARFKSEPQGKSHSAG